MIWKILKQMRDWFTRDRRASAYLHAIFAQGNLVEHSSSGLYRVIVGADLSSAFLRNTATGRDRLIDWLTPAGTVRRGVAEHWTLVETAPAA